MDDFDINPPACSFYLSLSQVTPDDASKTCFLRLFHFKKIQKEQNHSLQELQVPEMLRKFSA